MGKWPESIEYMIFLEALQRRIRSKAIILKDGGKQKKDKKKKEENIHTSQSHPCFITFPESTRWTIFSPKFINGAIISAGT